ncbi:MAG: hypothetical protein K2X28_06605, partial [Alphaproteobacteria bacterium]|nr:hypothetical protein [Alphaproteobacteria bacterium]
MIFRSLAISSSLLALLASGSVIAMEIEGNNASSPSKSLKRKGKEEDVPQANKKKQRTPSAADMRQIYPLTKQGDENLKKAAREGDKNARDEMIRRFADKRRSELDLEEDLENFLSWKKIEKYIVEKEGYASILYGFYHTDVPRFIGKIEEAAQRGLLNAQFALGMILLGGVDDENEQKIIKKDPVKAMEWFEKAALNG